MKNEWRRALKSRTLFVFISLATAVAALAAAAAVQALMRRVAAMVVRDGDRLMACTCVANAREAAQNKNIFEIIRSCVRERYLQTLLISRKLHCAEFK